MASKRKYPTKPIETSSEALADDAFVASVLEVSTWAKRHQQKLVAGGIVLALALASGWYYIGYRASLTEQAVTELERVQATIGMGDSEGARGQLQTYLERFGGTPYALEARLLLGQLNLQAGEPEQAISALEPLRSSLQNPVAIQGLALLAAAYEEAGRTSDAVAAYRRVAAEADLDFQAHEALMNAGRLLAADGDLAGAEAVYGELLAELDDTHPMRGVVELRRAELAARAEARS